MSASKSQPNAINEVQKIPEEETVLDFSYTKLEIGMHKRVGASVI